MSATGDAARAAHDEELKHPMPVIEIELAEVQKYGEIQLAVIEITNKQNEKARVWVSATSIGSDVNIGFSYNQNSNDRLLGMTMVEGSITPSFKSKLTITHL